jgi:hypothetical protein
MFPTDQRCSEPTVVPKSEAKGDGCPFRPVRKSLDTFRKQVEEPDRCRRTTDVIGPLETEEMRARNQRAKNPPEGGYNLLSLSTSDEASGGYKLIFNDVNHEA